MRYKTYIRYCFCLLIDAIFKKKKKKINLKHRKKSDIQATFFLKAGKTQNGDITCFPPPQRWPSLPVASALPSLQLQEYLTYSCGPLHMDKQRHDDQLEPTYNNSGLIQDVVLKTYRERWTMETRGRRVSERSAIVVRHDDDDY